MTELRRVRAGIFDDKKLYNLFQLKEAAKEAKEGKIESLKSMLISAEDAIKQVFPVYEMKDDKVLLKKLLTGKPLFKGDLKKDPKEERFAVFHKSRFVEIAKKTGEEGILARPEFVYT